MGNCHFKSEFETENVAALTKTNFNYQYCIGKGGFGKVWKVERKKTKQPYAMKEMSKARIITKRSIKSVMNERQILTQLHNPFIVNMYYAFQDRENLYLVMDLLSGGDLRYHICKHRRFTEEQTRFFIACLVAGLEYVHNKNILHRDIKPENLVLDEDGYLRITDFGIAREWRPENSQDTSGTPGYMAPEVMCRQNHGVAVDYFAAGVMAYECMFGRRPYVGKSRQEIRDHILAKQIQIKRNEIPKGWSVEAADFINKMIQRKPANRLGLNGPQEVKNHPWLKDFPWQDLWNRKLQAPFIPPKEDNFDQKNINEDWKDQEDEEFKQNLLSLRRNSIQAQFNGYYFDYQLAALSQNSAFINTNQIMYTQKSSGGKPLGANAAGMQYPRSERLSPKNSEKLLDKPTQASSLQSQSSSTTAQIPHKQIVQHSSLQPSIVSREAGVPLTNQSMALSGPPVPVRRSSGIFSGTQQPPQPGTAGSQQHQSSSILGQGGSSATLTLQQQQFIQSQLQQYQIQQQLKQQRQQILTSQGGNQQQQQLHHHQHLQNPQIIQSHPNHSSAGLNYSTQQQQQQHLLKQAQAYGSSMHGHSMSVAQTPTSGVSGLINFNSQPTLKSKRASSRQGTAQSTKNSNVVVMQQQQQQQQQYMGETGWKNSDRAGSRQDH